MEDVGEAENHGSDEPSGVAVFERTRQQILQQSAKQKFLGPCGEDQNFRSGERHGAERVSRGAEMDEANGFAERNDDDGGEEEVHGDGGGEAAAPFDGVADAVEASDEEESGEGGGEGEEDGESVSEFARVGEKEIHPAELHGEPDDEESGVVFPDAGGFSSGARGEERGNRYVEDAGEDEIPARGIGVERVNEKCGERDEWGEEECVSAEDGDEARGDGRAGGEDFGGEEYGGDGDGDGEDASRVAEAEADEDAEEEEGGPEGEGGGEGHLVGAG